MGQETKFETELTIYTDRSGRQHALTILYFKQPSLLTALVDENYSQLIGRVSRKKFLANLGLSDKAKGIVIHNPFTNEYFSIWKLIPAYMN